MIVVDIGCARYGGDYSIERLLEMYDPDYLYGFDPAWSSEMFLPPADLRAYVHVSNEVAWTYDGQVRFLVDGLNGQVGDAEHWPLVSCVDLARVIDGLLDDQVVLKLDAEGAEYELLPHLIRRGIDSRLTRLLVEWHPTDNPALRRRIVKNLMCPLEEWNW